jgi:hypothetical protein
MRKKIAVGLGLVAGETAASGAAAPKARRGQLFGRVSGVQARHLRCRGAGVWEGFAEVLGCWAMLVSRLWLAPPANSL